jgi:hypothetical protein
VPRHMSTMPPGDEGKHADDVEIHAQSLELYTTFRILAYS